MSQQELGDIIVAAGGVPTVGVPFKAAVATIKSSVVVVQGGSAVGATNSNSDDGGGGGGGGGTSEKGGGVVATVGTTTVVRVFKLRRTTPEERAVANSSGASSEGSYPPHPHPRSLLGATEKAAPPPVWKREFSRIDAFRQVCSDSLHTS